MMLGISQFGFIALLVLTQTNAQLTGTLELTNSDAGTMCDMVIDLTDGSNGPAWSSNTAIDQQIIFGIYDLDDGQIATPTIRIQFSRADTTFVPTLTGVQKDEEIDSDRRRLAIQNGWSENLSP